MADETASTSAPVETTTPKKSPKKATAASKAAKIARPKASHPTTAVMVNGAIQNLKERGGSSLQAIKKYMSSTYKVDAEKLAPFIKKYIKASVASGVLVQTKGKGASGSFKLAATGPKTKVAKSPSSSPKVKKTVAKKPAAVKKPAATKKAKTPEKAATTAAAAPKKASPAKRVAKPKKSPAKKPAAAVPAPSAAATKPKSPAKAKKTTKSPVKKPKSPKAKTTKPKAAAKAKKASPKKK